jgi:hypothetical protein
MILTGIVWRIVCGLAVGAVASHRSFSFWPYFWFGVVAGLIVPLITLSIALRRVSQT